MKRAVVQVTAEVGVWVEDGTTAPFAAAELARQGVTTDACLLAAAHEVTEARRYGSDRRGEISVQFVRWGH